jgi:hypothetical protein
MSLTPSRICTAKRHGSKDPPLQGLPGGGPGCAGSGALYPVNRLGAGVRELLGTSGKPFADGIPPDIAGDVLYLIRWPENVVIVTLFPEGATVGFAKLEGRALFEEADEFEQVAAIVCSLDKNMKVVGHQAIRVKPVGMAGCAFKQQGEDTLSGGFLAEVGRTVVAANSDEIGLATEVVFRRKPRCLAMDGHTEQ